MLVSVPLVIYTDFGNLDLCHGMVYHKEKKM